MSKHTPGPWTAKIVDGKAHIVNIYGRGDVIATAYRHLGSPTLMDRDGEGEANARLIAAAPDLLAALESAVKALAVANIAGRSLYGAEVTESARAAIRAARGESNG